jgi:CheY-like chemotaxis protein
LTGSFNRQSTIGNCRKQNMNNRLKPILLADDSENDIELTVAALAQNNLANRVVTVRNGAEVLDYLYERGAYAIADRPVVVLLDIKMPKVSGLEALAVIKGDPQLKTIPVVMLTSSREGPDIQECYRLGVNAYVVKPVDFNAFFEAVKLVGGFWGVVNEPPVSAPKVES